MTLTRASTTMDRTDANNARLERKARLSWRRADAARRARPGLRGLGILCTALILLGSAPASAKPPRLTLLIVVDALGSDLLLRSKPRLKGGLARLIAEGAYYPTARYEYAKTDTASGHSTVATGANPWRHGIVGNQLVDRSTGTLIPIFAEEFPAWVRTFHSRQLPQSHFNQQWTLSLPPSEYLGDDDRQYESDWNA